MITSSSNQQMKNIALLNKKAKTRREQGIFVVEGRKMFQEAPAEWIEKVYLSESFEKANEIPLDGIEYEVVDDRVFAAVCDTKTPQGILCVVEQFRYRLEDLTRRENPHLLILENLQDPGNLGTILRTAEGAGADGIILNRASVDLYNPKTIRSTMGSVYRMPFLYVEEIEEILPELKRRNIRTYAAHLKGKNCYDEEDYRTGTAFFIGNEGNGLSERLSRMADVRIRIPMEGSLESLNAAVAASILMYEVNRQRRS